VGEEGQKSQEASGCEEKIGRQVGKKISKESCEEIGNESGISQEDGQKGQKIREKGGEVGGPEEVRCQASQEGCSQAGRTSA